MDKKTAEVTMHQALSLFGEGAKGELIESPNEPGQYRWIITNAARNVSLRYMRHARTYLACASFQLGVNRASIQEEGKSPGQAMLALKAHLQAHRAALEAIEI